jgi:hypothetical protein
MSIMNRSRFGPRRIRRYTRSLSTRLPARVVNSNIARFARAARRATFFTV